MAGALDDIMERASQFLVEMDYLNCETQCLSALSLARQQKDWANYARILLPLQESRRQRRMIAAEGSFRLGCSDPHEDPAQWPLVTGCVVVTRPHGPATAEALTEAAQVGRRWVEVLFADNPVNAESWTLQSASGPTIRCQVQAPPPQLIDQWMEPPDLPGVALDRTGQAAAWFLRASECLGDAALAQIGPELTGIRRVEALEACLEAIPDHEILHQRLGEIARQIGRSI